MLMKVFLASPDPKEGSESCHLLRAVSPAVVAFLILERMKSKEKTQKRCVGIYRFGSSVDSVCWRRGKPVP